jgi:hypothetical protein
MLSSSVSGTAASCAPAIPTEININNTPVDIPARTHRFITITSLKRLFPNPDA